MASLAGDHARARGRSRLGGIVGATLVAVCGGSGCGSEVPGPRARAVAQAIAGGAGDVTIRVAGTVVNRYAPLAADAVVGATSITLTGGAALGPVTAGDLAMIVQMQGAAIDTTNGASYGSITALNGAGLYELVTLASLAGDTLTLDAGCGLRNAYSAAAHAQVVWIPQYRSVTVTSPGSITAAPWDGSIGGIVALQADDASLVAPSAIDVAGLGFRGGVVKTLTTFPVTGPPAYASSDITRGAEKGESIAGYHAEYDASGGRYGIGAPANGGGGGGPHNAGGGGGANGDDGQPWTGAGVMPAGAVGAAAWSLDPDQIAASALTASSGGGRGGYAYSWNAQDPLSVAPGDVSWGGDLRQQHGGRGGRPIAGDPLARAFLGGGGGAGESNDITGTDGGRGGGIAYVVARRIDGAGTGSIVADGRAAATTSTTNGMHGNDAPGGGGAGGTVVLVSDVVSGLAISAAGGAGGNQHILEPTEAEGPGGGGGGGFVAAPAGLAVGAPPGGAGGTTDSPSMTAFPRNGATDGAAGGVASIPTAAKPSMCIATDLAVAMTGSASDVTAGTAITYSIRVTNAGPNPVTGAIVTDAFPSTLAALVWTCAGTACGSTRGAGSISAVLGTLAAGDSVTFTVAGVLSASATGTISNSATVAPPAGIVDGVPADDRATLVRTIVTSADLGATLSHAPAAVIARAAYSYTAAATNGGPSDASNVTVTLTIPGSAALVGVTAPDWSCTSAGTTITCSRPTLAVGASSPIGVDVTAPSAPGAGVATMTVNASTPDPNGANDHANDDVTFGCAVDADCAPGRVCSSDNRCVPGADAGAVDASDAGIDASDATADASDTLGDASDATADASDTLGDASDATADASDIPHDASDIPHDASDIPHDASDIPHDHDASEMAATAVPGGCSCRTAMGARDASPGALAAAAALLLVARRRRRHTGAVPNF